ncbi:hypothetical protein MRS44_005796 [Fusarium solani]|uniref:Uncharacterized protein n=1 Tax=Fusarium solani TaxID=169388 RepID=A0A9P9L901_FUSSL|nr:uncharacterized protein B0J15DRAFT_558066 [Fusarium solani]KAH7276019.1 hypothetical protein B0J15DRAFT_558066 [Fusarium solani]KAJ3465138.1 hypothetical protein MRS44_005796 [Fusarium solani]
MLFPLVLGLLRVVHGVVHNATYDEYPNYAITCLSYNGTEFPNNFANNCDYASGECCTSPYKAIIAATWEYGADDEGEDKDKDDDDNFAGTGLSNAQIIGIAVGAGVTATVTAIGLVLKCCFEELWNSCLGRSR